MAEGLGSFNVGWFSPLIPDLNLIQHLWDEPEDQ